MHIIDVDPKECRRWQYADRSPFEFGDLTKLAQDIKVNGQIEPIYLRPLANNDEFKYEVIAGSRRWKACLENNLLLKAIVDDVSDERAAIIQIKENQRHKICDYSKGIYYTKLLKDEKITQEELAKNLNINRSKLRNFLYFTKIPNDIWDKVENMTKVTARTACAIYSLSQKGEKYTSTLIDLADEIRKGTGARKLERLVQAKVPKGNDNLKETENSSNPLDEITITLSSGIIIGTWKNNTITFNKQLSLKPNKLIKYLTKYFENKHSK
ncbi:MAG TPA: ParB/RepB/Spo0J family partition protein [Rickettsia endosymbiont of Omalisus fontisbellaquei]|nr:ParB/RepB/Spo0J family partition protein [Rickettsia endosymbiont of Omalisus fontisbellaquei]